VWGIYLKKVEIESFVKSFLIFFLSQLILSSGLFFMEYKRELKSLDELIFSEMRICSFDLECPKYTIDFAPLEREKLYKLHKTDARLSAFFTISGASQNALEIYLPRVKYEQELALLKSRVVVEYLFVVFILIILSVVFALYTLWPLRNALRLTEEFIKDILHDYNTPLATLRLNASMLKEEIGESKKLQRIENSVQNILNLQGNLRAYLHNHKSQKSSFALKHFIEERVALLQGSSKNREFFIDIEDVVLTTNQEAFARIIDNLLSNALKYAEGSVVIRIEYRATLLKIVDNAKGIKNPSRVFERFYKEQERGVGIGLHIVKKLSDSLGIKISLESEVGVGTTFFLELKALL